MLTDEELLRYSRHLLLDGIGLDGQEKFKQSRVAIIGAGGLGNPLALYLAAAGVGTLDLYDADTVDLSNLQRQIAFTEENVDQAKVDVLEQRLSNLNPHIKINSSKHKVTLPLTEAQRQALESCCLIIDCTDNFQTRYALNQISLQLNVPLLMGAAIEHQGLAALLNHRQDAPCYACLFDEADETQGETRCSEAGVFAPLLGIVGSTLASLALQFLLGKTLQSQLYSWDLKSNRQRQSLVTQNAQCRYCGQ